MMNLDEAIQHCEEKAKELRTEAEQLRDIGDAISNSKQPYNEPVKNCRECAEEHEQLAEWLKDYKRLLEEKTQGEWIKVTKAGTVPVEYICSLCRRKIYDYYELTTPIDEFYPFCHCGADMRKGGTENG